MTLRWLPGPWVKDALCAQTDPEVFFPDRGQSTAPAIRICRHCPVRAECLAFAMEHREQGVWGGLSQAQRSRRGAPATQPPVALPRPNRCGTPAGYQAHWRAGQPACDACLRAVRDRDKVRRARAVAS